MIKKSQVETLGLFLFVSSVLIFFFNNCAPHEMASQNFAPSTYIAPSGLPKINYFNEARPSLICGVEGWAYLQRNYITHNCSGCHYQGSIAAPFMFADRNIELAYADAKLISKTAWHSFSTNNRFCFPNCNILPEGEVYHGLMEWVDHPRCP